MKKIILFALLSIAANVVPQYAHAQYINRYAGNGYTGYSGDGGQATAASIAGPCDLAFNSSGNAYFTDVNNHVIRKISTTGIITTIAGTGTAGTSGDGGAATAATLDAPFSIAVSSGGNIYFTDYNQHTIRRVNTAGTITKIAGITGSAGYSGDGGQATAAQLNTPIGLAIDASGNVYFSDVNNNVVRKISTSGIITTIAGNGSAGYSGDGGAATAATLNAPTGLAVDASGNLYIADFVNSVIRKRTSSGIISTYAGTGSAGYTGDGGAATSAQLRNPEGVIADANGNIFIADRYNSVIRRVNASGIITTVTGQGYASSGGDGDLATRASLYSPIGLRLDATGNLYIADNGNNAIRKINTGIVIESSSAGTCAGDSIMFRSDVFTNVAAPYYLWKINGTSAGANSPTFVTAALANGDIVTCQLRTTTATGALIGTSNGITISVANPPGLTPGANPVVCAGDTVANFNYSGVINNPNTASVNWDSAGAAQGFIDTSYGKIITTIVGSASGGYGGDHGLATAALINNPSGIARDAAGNMYIADRFNYVIRKVNTAGVISTFAGAGSPGYSGDGGPATNAHFSTSGITTDASGNVYFTDPSVSVIRKINTSGVISTIAGYGSSGYSGDGGAATAAQLNVPTGILVTSSGTIYFSDANNSVVRKITAAGIISTVAGTGTYGHTGDRGPATAATLGSPTGLAIDAAGNLYIADASNYVRKVNTSGIISTIAGNGSSYFYGEGYPATIASVGSPQGIAVTAAGDVLISEYYFQVVRKIDVFGNIHTVAGTLGYASFGGDGRAATSCYMTYPTSVITDTAGNIYLTEGDRVRKITSFPASPIRLKVPATAAPGTYSGTLTVSNGLCRDTTYRFTVNVFPLPVAGTITGPSVVCVSSGITLSDTTTGGIWTRTNSTATVTGGLVTGVSAGIDTIKYTVTTGCGTSVAQKIVTVNPLPNAGSISGPASVCTSATITLTDAATGGSWSATNASAIVSSAGIVGGLMAGTDTIKYTVTNSCGNDVASKIITINAAPGAGSISGSTSVCVSGAVTLAHSIGGGTWSATNAHAFISAGGLVTGLSTGLDTILYVTTGTCGTATATYVITINPAATAGTISGPAIVCAGSAITLSGSVSGGSWAASNGNAAITSRGILNGVIAGADTITYTVTSACGTSSTSTVVTVNPLPNAGTISGATTLCATASTSLTESATGGSWSASNSHATVSSAGLITGISAGIDTIIYAVTNSCGTATASRIITINPMPAAGSIAGASSVCASAAITLTDAASGGTWSATNSHAFITSGGVLTGISAGVDTIVYTVTNSCGTATATTTITVNPLPNAGSISGASTLCASATTPLTDAASGGTWSATNSHATVSSAGLITAISAGADTVIYTVTNGCGTATTSFVITINPAPNAGTITGPATVCQGTTITLADAATGGSWTATNSHATVSSTGLVSGISAGADTIIYTVTNSCGTATTNYVITVNPAPNAGAISGAATVCMAATTALTASVTGGSWTATNGHATISSTGSVTGVTAGIDTIIYTFTNSCGTATTSRVITISPAPVAGTITGLSTVCISASISLTDSATGGVWTATNTRALVTSTGSVFGLTTGIDTIMYTVTNSCGTVAATRVVTINPLPNAGTISGPSHVCINSAITLTNTVTSGTWLATNANGTLSGATFTGAIAGLDTIIYKDSNSCGIATTAMVVTVNPLPVPVIVRTGSVLSTTLGYTTYQWILNGAPITGETNSTANAGQDGRYTVQVTDANGCSALSDSLHVSLGVNEASSDVTLINIYPNPSESIVHIESPVKVNITLLTIDGRVVMTGQDTQSADLSTLANGTYMLVVYDNKTGTKLKTERIVKMGN